MARVTLASRLPAIAAGLRPRVSGAVKAGAEAVAEDARQRVELGPPPVHIQESIEVRRHEAAAYLVVVDAEDPKGIPYPFVVEFGSVNMPAYPFLVPALADQAEHIEDLVKSALRGL